MRPRSFFVITLTTLAAIGAALGQVTSADQTTPVKVFGPEVNLFGPQEAEFAQNIKRFSSILIPTRHPQMKKCCAAMFSG